MTTTPTIGKDDDYCITSGTPKRAAKLVNRLNQHANEPGIYPMTLVVRKDGRWQLVVEAGKVEELG